MTDSINRPPNGYAISLYDELRAAIPFYAEQISATQKAIENSQRHMAWCSDRLAEAESTLAWMREHQADEIKAHESERVQKLAALFKPDR